MPLFIILRAQPVQLRREWSIEMTLGQAKAMTMKLLDDYMIEAPPTDDEETLAKLNAMFQSAQVFLSTVKPIRKACTISHTPTDTWYAEYDLPDDFSQAYKVRDETGDNYSVEFLGTKILVEDTQPHTLRIDYYAFPTEITDETTDDFVFELSQDAQQVLPYAVAADLLKTDPSADYTAFEVKYNNLVQNLDPRQSVGISFVGGQAI